MLSPILRSKENSDFDLQLVEWVNRYLKYVYWRRHSKLYNVRYLKCVNKVNKFACFDFSSFWSLNLMSFDVKEFSISSYS